MNCVLDSEYCRLQNVAEVYADFSIPYPVSPPFHEARTQPELAVMIREGKIPDLPKPYTPHLGQVVKAMLKQSVGLTSFELRFLLSLI